MRATVLVRPKRGILDPQGQAVETALEHLGFAVGGARVGRLVDLELETHDATEARAQVERMCEQLLANPLIESYEIEISGSWTGTAPAGRAATPATRTGEPATGVDA